MNSRSAVFEDNPVPLTPKDRGVSAAKGSSLLPPSKKSAAGVFNRASGFSLIELMIVVALVVLIIAVAVPDLATFNRSYKIRDGADSVANLVSLARMRAAATFSRVEVLCSASTNQCTLQREPYQGTWSADNNKETVTLPSGVSFAIPAGISAGAGGQSGEAPSQGSTAQTTAFTMVFNSRGFPIVDNTNGSAVTDYAFYLQGPNGVSMAVAPDGSGTPYEYLLQGSTWQLATN